MLADASSRHKYYLCKLGRKNRLVKRVMEASLRSNTISTATVDFQGVIQNTATSKLNLARTV